MQKQNRGAAPDVIVRGLWTLPGITDHSSPPPPSSVYVRRAVFSTPLLFLPLTKPATRRTTFHLQRAAAFFEMNSIIEDRKRSLSISIQNPRQGEQNNSERLDGGVGGKRERGERWLRKLHTINSILRHFFVAKWLCTETQARFFGNGNVNTILWFLKYVTSSVVNGNMFQSILICACSGIYFFHEAAVYTINALVSPVHLLAFVSELRNGNSQRRSTIFSSRHMYEFVQPH